MSPERTEEEATWVFGYGSLIWKQDFPFLEARRAGIDGWMRRLWQGSHDHRGTPAAPGRVATIVEAPGARCLGKAFLVEPGVFEHLDHREKNGYRRIELPIRFDDGAMDGVTYIAPTGNHAFLGDAPLDEMVEQIRCSAGESGSNVEYVLELAAALRHLEVDDPHVFEVASRLREATASR